MADLRISGASGKLNGTKIFVTDAQVADIIIVIAQ